ncbi:MAG TPA: hypothetical protein VMV94_16815 [Phycisphaerae bacterium]|nr:hypothetical protein [Phycisphaerae bacterium]
MRSCVTSLLCGLIICGLAVSVAQAGGKVDNPMYKHWAQFKPGSFSETKSEINMGDTKINSTTTMTLKELTPEKAVVEVKAVSVMGGQNMEAPPHMLDIPAKIEEEKAKEIDPPKKGDKVNGADVQEVKQGEEELQIADQKLKCKWVELKLVVNDQITTQKTWTSEDVPGRVVKNVLSVAGKQKGDTQSLVSKFKGDKGAKTEPKAGADKEKGEKRDAGDKKAPTGKKETTEKKEQKEKK